MPAIIMSVFGYLLKKFGIGAVKLFIQKAASVIVIGVTISFYASVIVFISETITQFRQVLAIINNPSASTVSTSTAQSRELLSCFINLYYASGMASGLNSAFSFFIVVVFFFFTRALYSMTQKSLKIISDEISKSLKLV